MWPSRSEVPSGRVALPERSGRGCVHTAGVMMPCRALCPVGSLCVLLVLAASCAAPAKTPVTTPAPTPPSSVATPAPPAAGTPTLWRITHPGKPGDIEGFADHTSITAGQRVQLFVSTTAHTYRATAYRMGAATQQVWTSTPQPGSKQAAAIVTQPTKHRHRAVAALADAADRGVGPGDYLVRLDGDNDAQQFVPLTVRTPSNTRALPTSTRSRMTRPRRRTAGR